MSISSTSALFLFIKITPDVSPLRPLLQVVYVCHVHWGNAVRSLSMETVAYSRASGVEVSSCLALEIYFDHEIATPSYDRIFWSHPL